MSVYKNALANGHLSFKHLLSCCLAGFTSMVQPFMAVSGADEKLWERAMNLYSAWPQGSQTGSRPASRLAFEARIVLVALP